MNIDILWDSNHVLVTGEMPLITCLREIHVIDIQAKLSLCAAFTGRVALQRDIIIVEFVAPYGSVIILKRRQTASH